VGLSGVLTICTMAAHSTGVNMTINHLVEDLGLTRTQVSLVWVCALFISATAMPFAGAALDKMGSRKLLCIVSPLYILFVSCMGLVNSWYTLALCLTGLRFVGAECLVLIS
jgi:MFS family permease